LNWFINTASIVGRDHQLSFKNRQDFAHSHQTPELLVATVCDGCGESKYSEVGATLIGTYIVNFVRTLQDAKFKVIDSERLKDLIEYELDLFVKRLLGVLFFDDVWVPERISFVKEMLLSTCLFTILVNDKVIVGNCGDGIIILNKQIHEIHQAGTPEYIAYKAIPKEALEKRPTELSFFTIKVFDQNEIDSIIIGTDGIQPLIDNGLDSQLYGTHKRQLQRKFNLWHDQKLFGDDATCIVIEKQNGDQNSNLQE
jgi:serine/threonine protein phosphatase PrpC